MDTKLLSLAAALIAPSLSNILNLSLKSGIVPNDWKLARVTPIYKGKGDKNDKNFYRPISVIATISMIMEREVHSQIMTYFTVHNLITIDQFAFLKYHSTSTCLHRMMDDWYEAMNENEFIITCFFDIQKCFDSINHRILLQKLSLYGVNGNELRWFENYLFNRTQYVACNNVLSDSRTVSTGVPQGSALGPFLFLAFINDFPQHIHNASSNLFADDASVYVTGRDLSNTVSNMQSSINQASEWYRNNNLPVNAPKTVCMLSGTECKLNRLSENEKKLNLIFNDVTLQQVSTCPYLGVQLDENMKWSHHVQYLCRNLSYKVSMLGRLRKIMSPVMLNRIYLTYIQPSLDYAISVWGHCNQNFKKCVIRIQHRAARIVTGQFDYVNVRGHDLMTQLNWQSVDQRRDYFTANIMFKSINGIAPVHIRNEISLVSEIHDGNTR